MRDISRLLKARLDRLQKRRPAEYVSLFDVLSGAVPMPDDAELLDPRHRAALDAFAQLPDVIPDGVEEAIAAALLEQPTAYGLKELTAPDLSINPDPESEGDCNGDDCREVGS